MNPELLLADPDWPYSKAKTAVLLAAASVIREQGPRSATLKNIARKAGITEPAIFRHFDGVDGLFSGLFSVCEMFFAKAAKVYGASGPGLEGYLDSTAEVLRILSSGGDFAYLIFFSAQVFSGYEDFRIKTRQLKLQDESFGIATLGQALERGELKAGLSVENLALALMGIVHMTTVSWLESDSSFDLAEVCLQRLRGLFTLLSA